MGCAQSRCVEKEETVRRCRERKRLMKQLLGCRAELAAAHLDYLRSLKNTGATLRQFTEAHVYSTTSITTNQPLIDLLPPPPPPPPPPPHLPQFASCAQLTTKPLDDIRQDVADIERKDDLHDGEGDGDDDDDNESCGPPPPPLVPFSGSAWEFRDPFGPSGPSSSNSSSRHEEGAAEDEDWAEADTEFRDDDDDNDDQQLEGNNALCDNNVVFDILAKKEEEVPLPLPSCKDEILVDDDSSVMSLLTKDTDMALVVWRTNKSLAGIAKEIDDYFLKAAAAGNDVLLLLDSDQAHRLRKMEQFKGKRARSTKVFSAFPWNWFFRSPQSSQNACCQEPRNNMSDNHCATLECLYAKEQRLYKEVKEEELIRVLQRKKRLLLQKLETRQGDCTATEEMRSDVENLHSKLLSLQESINMICLSISELRDKELYPQLTELIFGFMQMWRVMYECHQVQNHIAQQANLLDNHRGFEPTTEAHHFATAQLEAEVTHWHSSFCNLLKYQRSYVQILSQWVTLTDCLPDAGEMDGSACGIHHLCEEWQLSLDRLPDKVASEAIKSFLSMIHSILLQQKEELDLQKKSRRLESRLEKELTSFSDLDKHVENSVVQCPLSAAKLEALKKKVEGQKSKYLNSVRNSRAVTLNNLQTGLPNVFQALMGFAGVCVQAFERVCLPSQTSPLHHTGTLSPSI